MIGSNSENRVYAHNHPIYYGIQFCYQGKLQLRINEGQIYQSEGGHAFLTYPGADFEYGAVDGLPWSHYYVCAYGERIQKYLETGLINLSAEPPLIRIRDPKSFLQTILDIMALAKIPGQLSPRAVLLFEDLLLEIHESSKTQNNPLLYQAPFLQALIEKICNSPAVHWDFNKEAEKCHITSTHFRRLFKQFTGMPPRKFLLHLRLRKASQLLIYTHKNVQEIAYEVGIENIYYFSSIFRKKYQISPFNYRNEFNIQRQSQTIL